MSISSISPSTLPSPSEGTGKRKTSLNQEDFLNLFITQLKNQNPLNPMDHYQMATQIAQFNSLDSLNRIQHSLEALSAYQASMNGLQATGLIGKRAEVQNPSLSLSGGKVSEGYYQLSRPGKVTIQIYDGKGQLVRTLEEGIKDPSRQKVVWDGKSDTGVKLPDGQYAFQVIAIDEKGVPLPVESTIIDTITGIQFENGIIYLNLGSGRVTLQDVKAILNPSS